MAWIPSYGPEMRGGTAYCTVVIGDTPIGSPIIQNPMNLVAMNQPSMEKFSKLVKPNGLILKNSSLVPINSERSDLNEYEIAANAIANDLGTIKVANIVALGAFVQKTRIFSFDLIQDILKKELSKKPELLKINLKAVQRGKESVN
ncbi:MAG: 2-oxoglutarate ferredoxin oxidoreductase subunit gamma [Candidatus Magnetoglobus multicellularis str. Araruama]|uniref:2-oxoglutarate ferredoxin oxidoreductase subunit gamma n=1 Tax=Candidatus Magnetoglobus multicellularis str. Araruama TaxID=890399 RepID=A0A1V1PCL0_9BACT|nr:MAG: 2-oxoglutarate ferredoxin oxidoreductase subunit gamma [Candidatus Magnetoglobus multicellularis str. Araruama]